MADEPVKLKDLIQSLASTMVVTSHFLDQANVDLRNQYALSGDGALASLSPPRFTLDEMTIDLSFVVEEAAVVPPGRGPGQPTPRVSLTDSQRRVMFEKLGALTRFEQQTIQFEAQRSRIQSELRAAQAKERDVTRQVDVTRREIATLDARIRSIRSSPLAAPQRAAFEQQKRAKQAQLASLSAAQATARQALAAVQNRLGALKPPQKPASVVAGPQPRAVVNYRQLVVDFEQSYESLKSAYEAALAAFRAERALPRFERFRPLDPRLSPALTRAGVAAATRTRMEAMEADFAATQTMLGDLVALVAALKGEGIRVRVDPESISQAAESARQHVRLTFRAESQETVQVEGEERDLP